MDLKEVKQNLVENNIKVKKHFGQNFLIDDNVLKKIISAASINKETTVIEIGPGMGSLTEYLVKEAKEVICYEIDPDMVLILKNRFSNHNNLKIVEKDFLKVKIDLDVQERENIKVVANLPYYITTPILLKILEEMDYVDEIIVMIQKEVAERICGKPSTKDYNSLSVLMQYKHQAKLLFDVKKGSFYPEPDVTSSIIKISKNNQFIKAVNEQFFYQFNRNIFRQRRKTLINNLKASYSCSKEIIEKTFYECNLNVNIRAEALSVLEIINFSDAFFSLLNQHKE